MRCRWCAAACGPLLTPRATWWAGAGAGTDGDLARDAEPLEIINAIRCVSKGQNYVNASIVTLLVNTYVCRNRRGELADPYDVLSEREREILCLAATGHTNHEIAETLHLRQHTVA